MATIEYTGRSYSRTYRIFHWAIAILFLLLLITIFLRLTWMNKDHVAGIIGSYLGTTDQSLSQQQLIVLAKQIREPMWQWHVYIGYALAGLCLVRFMLPLFGEMRLPDPRKRTGRKEKFQEWTYIVFYIGVVISLITGLIIELGPKQLKDPVEQIHVLSIYYLVPFIVVHLAGILWAEFTDQKGIVSRIVSGR